MKKLLTTAAIFIAFLQNLAAQKNDIIESMLYLQESPYVHFNKSYFYPGEQLAWKSYMLFADARYRDSLSKVLYIDLLTTEKQQLKHFRRPIINGAASGDFIVPDTLKQGTYYLRFYTSWMRNYGDSTFQYYPIRVIDSYQNPKNEVAPNKTCGYFQKPTNTFKLTDSVTVTLKIPLLKNYSVSVIDTFSVKRLKIINQPKIYNDLDSTKLVAIKYPIERSLIINSKVMAGNKVLKDSDISSYRPFYKQTQAITTNANGEFSYTWDGENETEPLIIGFGKTKKIPQLINLYTNPIIPKLSELPVKYESIRQEIYKDSITKGTINLDEFTVKARRIEEEKPRINNTYGKADNVITSQDLKNSLVDNPLLALQGRVPGLRITSNNPLTIDLRGGSTSSFQGAPNPLLLIDGVPMAALEDASMVSMQNIERIEIVKRLVPAMGSSSSSGVINIITKTTINGYVSEVDAKVVTLNLLGYSKQNIYKPNNQCQLWQTNGLVAKNGEVNVKFKSKPYGAVYFIELVGTLENGNLVKCGGYVKVD
jgi:TonB-dependent Receptor Plug Domain